MKKAIAMADNCIDVYYRMDRYYLTGNSIDFALNYKAQGGDVTEMTVLGNDVFADALVERLKQRDIPLRVLKRIDRPTGMAKPGCGRTGYCLYFITPAGFAQVDGMCYNNASFHYKI